MVTSVGVTCAAALTLPLAAPALSAPVPHAVSARPPSLSPESPGAGPPAATGTPAESRPAESRVREPGADGLAGSTQSLPLEPLATSSDRSAGPATPGRGLDRRTTRPFSLVGVVWDDAEAELHGTVQVRARAAGGESWSDWQDVETHNTEHAADLGSDERASGAVRGATAPLWVGPSDGVEVRVQPETGDQQGRLIPVRLPEGLRLELVDPGPDPAPEPAADDSGGRTAAQARPAAHPGPPTVPAAPALPEALTVESAAASAVNAEFAPLGASVIPALTEAEAAEAAAEAEAEAEAVGAKPYIGPRPRIVTRKGWGADERLRERNFAYTRTVKAAFVHHSATGNNYTCKQAPSVLRSIYRYHVKSSGWRDFGYNFAVDKCGNIYEGRAGGVSRAVLGAHTLGFNSNTMGIAVLGSYSSTNPPAAAVAGVSQLTAWKLGLFGRNPKGKVTLVSGGSNKYKKGKKVKMNVISGHRDGFATECPGARLYKKLGKARTTSAKLQGR
ncbi:N-acetylmuramoyl-L-alanine amidase [Streptomyces sp. NPDC087897]|uniref:N-acetylmuramoyl-L-alanine amidase n=1 Tax=Streptomyces sp. NPDC087897 TaxID=3365817 RepID=UPI0038179DCE